MSMLESFISLLAALVAQYFQEIVDPSLKPIDSTGLLHCRNITFDFIIVGAGSAGSVLANRLSANPDWNVLLIEAGGDETLLSQIPPMHFTFVNNEILWNYTTEPQKRACRDNDGKCFYPRGHVMGGSSAVNAMIYCRGNPKDFDEWEAMGNPGWAYKDVLKYFRISENMNDPHLAQSIYHSTGGPLSVGYSKYKAKIYRDLFQAGKEYGLEEVDYNSDRQVGISYSQLTVDGATRCSTSKAFLNPIRSRPNLYIFKNTLVTKIIFNKLTKTAVGVTCVTRGEQYNVYSSKEVILSAGAINTPQLLMLSGVGPKEHLIEKGISVLADLPVGHNLLDHTRVNVAYKADCEECYEPYNRTTALNYAKYKSGELTSNFLELLMFMNRKNSSAEVPDIQFLVLVSNFIVYKPYNESFVVSVCNLKPKSRGTIKLRTNNPFDPPIIDPNYYGVENDMELTKWGVQQAFKYVKSPSMMKYSLKLIANESCASIEDEASFLSCYVEHHTTTVYHPVSTCKMGPKSDPTTVVDPSLKVHGLNGLRVVDASVMPNMPRCNTNAATIMIAEKASDMIIESYHDYKHYGIPF